MRDEFEKIKEESRKMREQVQQQMVGYITAAFGLVAGLAWNQAIQALINHFFPKTGNSLTAQFIYAILITAVVVILTTYMIRFFKGEEEKE